MFNRTAPQSLTAGPVIFRGTPTLLFPRQYFHCLSQCPIFPYISGENDIRNSGETTLIPRLPDRNTRPDLSEYIRTPDPECLCSDIARGDAAFRYDKRRRDVQPSHQ